MAALCYIEKEDKPRVRKMTNNSGAAVVDGEFALLGKLPAVANGAIGSGAIGDFTVGGIRIQANDFVTSEDTFNTLNAPVYWEGTGKLFSDTRTAGYYEVGQVAIVKTGGIVMIDLYDVALVVPQVSGLVDVEITNLADNNILKYDAAGGVFQNEADAT